MLEERDIYRMPVAYARPRPAASPFRLARQRIILAVRLSLSAVFFWFGALKLVDASPVTDLLRNSFPILAHSPYLEALGLVEIAIAIGLISERFSKGAATLMIGHLLCTLSIMLVSPGLVFAPAFPVLTMQGEFLAKNVVLITAGLVVIDSRRR